MSFVSMTIEEVKGKSGLACSSGNITTDGVVGGAITDAATAGSSAVAGNF